MMRRLIGFLVLVLGLSAFVGCESGPGPIKPKGTVNVTLETAKKVTAIGLKVEHLLVVTLPPVPAGLSWQIAFHDSRYLKQVSDLKPASTVDAGATITFISLVRGKTRLKFLLAPTGNDREARPVDQQELVLEIQ